MVAISLLGTITVVANQQPVKFVTEPGRALFAYLVVQRERRFTRQQLATLLWPDEAEAKSLKRLRVTLSRLRSALTETGAPDPIVSDRFSIWIDPSAEIWLDSAECEQYLALDADSSTRWGMRRIVRWRERAADLYRWNFLADLHLDSFLLEEWVTLERTRWQQRIVLVLEQLATDYLTLHQPQKSIATAQRLLQIEPEREGGHRILMQAFVQMGRWLDAIKQYASCEAVLQEMWGVAPHPKTTELLDLARAGQAGEHRPIPRSSPPTTSLPLAHTPLIGRDNEVKKLIELLLDDGERLITIVGAGGCGKSHLAQVAATQASDYFPDGVWFIALDDTDTQDETQLAHSIAEQVGWQLDALATQESLVIFDNLTPAGRGLLVPLLKRAPRCAFLCTTREPLHQRGEYIMQLAGLALPLHDDDRDATSVQLLLERAERSGIKDDTIDLAAVVEVCRRVEGLPLGITLAAAQLRYRSVVAVAKLLSAELTATQQTPVRAAFNILWRLLPTNEREQLTQLATLPHTDELHSELARGSDPALVQMRGDGQVSLHPLIRELIVAQSADQPQWNLLPFFGRESEIAHLSERLTTPQQHLVTITGIGGVGKTQLARSLARRLRPRFKDGVYFVELADVQDDRVQLISEIANTLDCVLSPTRSTDDQLQQHLRPRQCLLILDNCEHLQNSIDIVGDLLAQAPQLTLLATSRLPLDLQQETIFRLDGLALPDEQIAVSAGRQYAAVQLFSERARHAQPNFAVTAANWHAVHAVCQRLDGTPLALKLAAALLQTYSVDELLAELNRSLNALQTNQRDISLRHRSILTILEATWAQLSADARRALTNLTHFRPDCTVAAASAVAQIPPHILNQLVSQSLVQRRENGRLTLHPLLRQFARRQAAPTPDVLQRHASYYMQMLSEWKRKLFGAQPLRSAAQLAPERANIMTAWRQHVTNRQATVAQFEIILRLHYLLGRWEELEALLEMMLDSADATLHIRVHLALARLKEEGSQLNAARRHLTSALNRLEREPDPANCARAYVVRGDIAQRDGFPDAARADFLQALAHAKESGAMAVELLALSRLTYFITGTTDYSDRAVALARQTGDSWLERQMINMQGISEANAGNYERAYHCFARLLDLNAAIGERHQRRISHFSNLANTLQLLGDFAGALAYYQRSIEIASVLHDERAVAFAHLGLSRAYVALGECEKGLASAESAAAVLLMQSARADQLFAYVTLGNAASACDRLPDAYAAYRQGIELAEQIGLAIFANLCRAGMIDLLLAQGDSAVAGEVAATLWQTLQNKPPNPSLSPSYIFLQTVRGLSAIADPRAAPLLATAYRFVEARSQAISDPHLRRTYRHAVAANRELIALYQQNSHG